ASNETSETFTGDCPSSSRMSLVQELLLMSAGSSVGAAVALDGRLDLTALAAAGQRLTARHELLRTVFGQVNGRPRQIVLEPAELIIPVVDLSDEPRTEQPALVAEQLRE